MKRFTLVLPTILALSACNTDGFEELPSVYIEKHKGETYVNTVPNTVPSTTPNTDTTKDNWVYRTVSNDNGIFNATATVYSINEYKMIGYETLKGNSFAQAERTKSAGTIEEKVTIFADSDIACTPSCKVMVKGNSNTTLTLTNAISMAVKGIDAATNKKLYDIFTNSNTVIVELPLVKEGLFPAEFRTGGFDKSKMKLYGE